MKVSDLKNVQSMSTSLDAEKELTIYWNAKEGIIDSMDKLRIFIWKSYGYPRHSLEIGSGKMPPPFYDIITLHKEGSGEPNPIQCKNNATIDEKSCVYNTVCINQIIKGQTIRSGPFAGQDPYDLCHTSTAALTAIDQDDELCPGYDSVPIGGCIEVNDYPEYGLNLDLISDRQNPVNIEIKSYDVGGNMYPTSLSTLPVYNNNVPTANPPEWVVDPFIIGCGDQTNKTVDLIFKPAVDQETAPENMQYKIEFYYEYGARDCVNPSDCYTNGELIFPWQQCNLISVEGQDHCYFLHEAPLIKDGETFYYKILARDGSYGQSFQWIEYATGMPPKNMTCVPRRSYDKNANNYTPVPLDSNTQPSEYEIVPYTYFIDKYPATLINLDSNAIEDVDNFRSEIDDIFYNQVKIDFETGGGCPDPLPIYSNDNNNESVIIGYEEQECIYPDPYVPLYTEFNTIREMPEIMPYGSRSSKNITPTTRVSQFEASVICSQTEIVDRFSGLNKRLPSILEYFKATKEVVDNIDTCISSTSGPVANNESRCLSYYRASDLIGNVGELTSTMFSLTSNYSFNPDRIYQLAYDKYSDNIKRITAPTGNRYPWKHFAQYTSNFNFTPGLSPSYIIKVFNWYGVPLENASNKPVPFVTSLSVKGVPADLPVSDDVLLLTADDPYISDYPLSIAKGGGYNLTEGEIGIWTTDLRLHGNQNDPAVGFRCVYDPRPDLH